METYALCHFVTGKRMAELTSCLYLDAWTNLSLTQTEDSLLFCQTHASFILYLPFA